MLRSWALRSAISEPKPKSLQVSLMVRRWSSASSATSEDEAEASSKSASEKRKLWLKAFVVHFKRLDLGPSTGGCPNQIVLVGWSPAHMDIPNLLCDLTCGEL